MVKVHSLRRGRAEAIEAVAHGTPGESRVVGKQVGQIALPPGTSINVILRGEQVMAAHHDTVVQAEDHLILFLADRRQVDQVERLFQTPGRFR
jgi:trk system potassium uptake protein TrkA